MSRGTRLSGEERAKIDAYTEEGLSIRRISKCLKRSRNVVSNYINDKNGYGKHYVTSGNSKLIERDKRSIIREASNSEKSASQIRNQLNLPVSTSRVQQIIFVVLDNNII